MKDAGRILLGFVLTIALATGLYASAVDQAVIINNERTSYVEVQRNGTIPTEDFTITGLKAGEQFYLSDRDSDVDNDASKYYLFDYTADSTDQYVISKFDVTTSDRCQLQIFTGSTRSNDGTLLTPTNFNFESSATPGLDIYDDSTVTSNGVTVATINVLSGTSSRTTLSLPPMVVDEDILFKIDATDNDTEVILELEWQENLLQSTNIVK